VSDLFDFAAALAREQAANARYETAHRRMLESFARDRARRYAELKAASTPNLCGGFIDQQTQAELDAENLALFDATEARTINSGKGGF